MSGLHREKCGKIRKYSGKRKTKRRTGPRRRSQDHCSIQQNVEVKLSSGHQSTWASSSHPPKMMADTNGTFAPANAKLHPAQPRPPYSSSNPPPRPPRSPRGVTSTSHHAVPTHLHLLDSESATGAMTTPIGDSTESPLSSSIDITASSTSSVGPKPGVTYPRFPRLAEYFIVVGAKQPLALLGARPPFSISHFAHFLATIFLNPFIYLFVNLYKYKKTNKNIIRGAEHGRGVGRAAAPV